MSSIRAEQHSRQNKGLLLLFIISIEAMLQCWQWDGWIWSLADLGGVPDAPTGNSGSATADYLSLIHELFYWERRMGYRWLRVKYCFHNNGVIIFQHIAGGESDKKVNFFPKGTKVNMKIEFAVPIFLKKKGADLFLKKYFSAKLLWLFCTLQRHFHVWLHFWRVRNSVSYRNTTCLKLGQQVTCSFLQFL